VHSAGRERRVTEYNITGRTRARVERRIRMLKERVRCNCNMLPYKTMPKVMMDETVHASNFWLNCFPLETRILQNVSPRGIVDGLQIDYNKHCRLQFGDYVQTHEPHDNSMTPCTIGAIALRPRGNKQWGDRFLSLGLGLEGSNGRNFQCRIR
jgi:hypothetical protein